MADGQETEIVSTDDKPGTLQDVLDALNPEAVQESVSEAEGEPDAPATPEAERTAPADLEDEEEVEVEVEEADDGEEVEDELAETEEAVEEDSDDEEGEAEGDEEGDEALTVTVGDLEIELDDEEAIGAIRALQDKAESASDLFAKQDMLETQARRNKVDADELASMEDELKADPVGYLAEKIGPNLRAAVAEDLLLDDAVWNALAEKIDEWQQDERTRKVSAETRRADRAEFKNQVEERKSQVKMGRENAWEVRDAIKEMGQNLPERKRLVWERAALSRVTDHVRRAEKAGKPIETLDPKALDGVLADEIDAFGIHAGTTPAKPGGKKKKPAEDAGEKFRAKTRKRKKVASTAPVGAGAGPARKEEYKDMSLGDALDSLKGR